MNSSYKKPVLAFGLVAPSLLMVVALGLGFHFRAQFEATYRARKSHYADYKRVEAQREVLERKIRAQEPHLNRWMALFQKATGSDVKVFFSDFQKNYESQEFVQTAFRRTSASGGIGGASSQPSIQIQLSFRGTYRILENAFLELESRMPHLQLDSLKLSISNQNSKILTADLIYTAWQKE
jgi:hypothetical protein